MKVSVSQMKAHDRRGLASQLFLVLGLVTLLSGCSGEETKDENADEGAPPAAQTDAVPTDGIDGATAATGTASPDPLSPDGVAGATPPAVPGADASSAPVPPDVPPVSVASGAPDASLTPTPSDSPSSVASSGLGSDPTASGSSTPDPDGSAKSSAGGGEGGDSAEGSSEYTVKRADTLIKIAFESYGDFSKWKEIYQLNKANLPNPNLISEGVSLKLPKPLHPPHLKRQGTSYVIKPGDTLAKIAAELYGNASKWKMLWNNNRQLITNPNRIFAGFKIYYQRIKGMPEPGEDGLPVTNSLVGGADPAPMGQMGQQSQAQAAQTAQMAQAAQTTMMGGGAQSGATGGAMMPGMVRDPSAMTPPAPFTTGAATAAPAPGNPADTSQPPLQPGALTGNPLPASP